MSTRMNYLKMSEVEYLVQTKMIGLLKMSLRMMWWKHCSMKAGKAGGPSEVTSYIKLCGEESVKD